LADEPGLGKTLTTIALILADHGSQQSQSSHVPHNMVAARLPPTLIVAPTPVIAAQWKNEIETFTEPAGRDTIVDDFSSSSSSLSSAPDATSSSFIASSLKGLKVMQYRGPPKPYTSEAAEELVVSLDGADIVLTDLGVIRKEYHFYSAQLSEYLSSKKSKFISPLFKTSWRRVIVDEVI
jgi:SNF2 family DNA or RNA helicase